MARGPEFHWKGTWTNGAGYALGDVVEYAGALYVCTAGVNVSVVGTTPGSDATVWTQFSGESGGGGGLPDFLETIDTAEAKQLLIHAFYDQTDSAFVIETDDEGTLRQILNFRPASAMGGGDLLIQDDFDNPTAQVDLYSYTTYANLTMAMPGETGQLALGVNSIDPATQLAMTAMAGQTAPLVELKDEVGHVVLSVMRDNTFNVPGSAIAMRYYDDGATFREAVFGVIARPHGDDSDSLVARVSGDAYSDPIYQYTELFCGIVDGPRYDFFVDTTGASLTGTAATGQTSAMLDLTADGGAHTLRVTGDNKVGFFDATPAAKPTGVAVTAAGVHAALVTLGLIAA